MAVINTVLLDFDGTVMDTNSVIIGSWQHTFRTIEGSERQVEEIVKTFGEPLDRTMAALFPDMDLDEAVSIYRSFHRDNFGEMIKLFPGVFELLKSLKGQGYKVGLVTSRLKATTMEGLEKYGIKEFFDTVVTADDTSRHKPDPEPVNIALNRLCSKPEESIMLGDTMHDVLCAKAAGVKSALVSWSLAVSEEERAGEGAPDFIIDEAEELMDILSRNS